MDLSHIKGFLTFFVRTSNSILYERVQGQGRLMSFARQYFAEVRLICENIDVELIDRMAQELAQLRRQGGRLFLIGVGGSAGNCSHAVNDFRKLCGIEAYSPVDNVSELTARINDEGWETVFAAWLEVISP